MADDNRPLKYMRYAIGEIVLVVVGILIALQINTWNEERKGKIELENYLIQMSDELALDVLFFDEEIRRNELRIRILTSVSQGNYSKEIIDEVSGILTIIMADRKFGITYENLKTQGLFDKIDNTELKYKITLYYEIDSQAFSVWTGWHKKFVPETIENYVALNLPVRSDLVVNSEKLINEIENGQLLSLIFYQIHAFESVSVIMKSNIEYANELISSIESEIH